MSMENEREEQVKKVKNSELAYNILRELWQSGDRIHDGLSPTELSERLDTSSQSINNYLKTLVSLDVVAKGEKRGRKQPYHVDLFGMRDLWDVLWEDYAENNSVVENYFGEQREGLKDLYEEFEMEKEFSEKELNRRVTAIILNYCRIRLGSDESTTLEELLVDDFKEGLEMLLLRVESTSEEDLPEVPEWLEVLNKILEIFLYTPRRQQNEADMVQALVEFNQQLEAGEIDMSIEDVDEEFLKEFKEVDQFRERLEGEN